MSRHSYSYIEPGIRPLVEALKRIDEVRTIASCEGHFWKNEHPYVYFYCPTAIAEMLSRHLYEAHMQGGFYWWWHLTGVFNEEHQLCFALEAPILNHRGSLLSTFTKFVLCRRKIDNDLQRLSRELNDFVDDWRQATRHVEPN